MVGQLLDAGAAVNAVLNNGWTPISAAAYRSDTEVVWRLLAAGGKWKLARTMVMQNCVVSEGRCHNGCVICQAASLCGTMLQLQRGQVP